MHGAMSADTMRRSGAEASSPELVLVDHMLARGARDELPEPADTIACIERDVAQRQLVVLASALPEDAGLGAARTHEPRRRAHDRTRARLVVGAALAASLAITLLLGVNVDFRGSPAGAGRTEPETTVAADTPPTPRTPTRAPESATRPGAVSPPTARRVFAWAPVPGASGYHMELYRGDSLIYAGDSDEPRLSQPGSWTLAGREQRLEPGAYRWYVWPVVDGLRQSHATVQAELVVP